MYAGGSSNPLDLETAWREAGRSAVLRLEGKGWPERHLADSFTGQPVPFHEAQNLAWDCKRRRVGLLAGTQSGKTTFGPWWLLREIRRREAQLGPRQVETPRHAWQSLGDFLVVTSNYRLFINKLLPEFLRVFEDILQLGRYYTGDKVFELRDPIHGYWADRSSDRMYGRIILGSASAAAGLEAATAWAVWLDEAGQDEFGYDAWKAITRRLSLTRGRVLITTTLYNLGWIKRHIIDRATDGGDVSTTVTDKGGEIEYTDNPDADIGLIQFDSIVNPMFSLEEWEEARLTMPTDEFEMFYRGRAAKLRYLIYDVFDPQKHTCPRFDIPMDWPRYMGMDFGGVNTAAMFYAEDPESARLYCYREYLEGGKTASEHVDDILEDEPRKPFAVGGSKSEGQWRDELRAAGLPIRSPRISDVNLQINRVYGLHKMDQVMYFDDLDGIIDEKARYKRKRTPEGDVTDKIENKEMFHRLDAERYILSYIRGDMGLTYQEWLRQRFGDKEEGGGSPPGEGRLPVPVGGEDAEEGEDTLTGLEWLAERLGLDPSELRGR